MKPNLDDIRLRILSISITSKTHLGENVDEFNGCVNILGYLRNLML
ncbi:MAG: hypothetical protein IPN97_08300 [Saprospiraceae bacterium]|nr:hypothetical protein [Saprospiraceae bacterium]